jgi:hypothetical protein
MFHILNNCEQVFGILRRGDTIANNRIVTRYLCVQPHSAIQGPCQRVKPVEGAREVRQRLNQPIMSANVLDLMN